MSNCLDRQQAERASCPASVERDRACLDAGDALRREAAATITPAILTVLGLTVRRSAREVLQDA
jgi:hypothetical protein